MDGNKDEALRCANIAKQAIAARNKQRALKFIAIAKRLNSNLPLTDLLSEAESIDSTSNNVGTSSNDVNNKAAGSSEGLSSGERVSNEEEERNYTEEHVHLVKQIRVKKDYYAILGVEKSCSVEEIRKAYRKLSLKVHPDKNKAPGSEEAFKKVSKAFKCLSEDDSRRQYDQTGLVDEFEHNQQYTGTRRRRRRNDFYEDEFDPDEIFRAFFGGRQDPFRNAHVYRARTTHNHQRGDAAGGPNLMLLLQLLPFLIIVLLAYLPFSEPEYSLQKNYSYQFKKTTEKYGVDYFVKSPAFDENYPTGGPDRHSIENNVIKDYKQMLVRYCNMEMQRRHWNRHFPTPHCNKLESFAA